MVDLRLRIVVSIACWNMGVGMIITTSLSASLFGWMILLQSYLWTGLFLSYMWKATR